MVSDPKMFTRAEDELILRQSRGEISFRELRQKLHANSISISRRATELGVKICNSKIRQPRKAKIALHTQDNLTPARIVNDKLLKRLTEVYGSPSMLAQQDIKIRSWKI